MSEKLTNLELLSQFLKDADSGTLKTSHYAKELLGFNLKVSFGMGAPARVPWMSFTTPEMSTSNGYYPVYLYFKQEQRLVLAFGISETNEFSKTWDEKYISGKPLVGDLIPTAPRYRDSWVFRDYEVTSDGQSPVIAISGVAASAKTLETDLTEILKLFSESLEVEITDRDSELGAGLFYMEKQLEDFIIRNWEQTDLGDSLELIYEEGALLSQQYRTSVGPIDILARDKKTGDYVVIELKRNQTSDDTVGQVMRYMGWVEENLVGSKVRGIIIAGSFDERLRLALLRQPDIEVLVYRVDFKLTEHKR